VHGETERETVLYNKQFDKLLHDVSYSRTHGANSQPFGDWGVEERNREREGEVSEGMSLITIQPFACEKKRFAQMFTDGRTDAARRTVAYICHSV